jgi:gamma-glutamylcyclotransferase (GGCT)/AIG2-like uncharacterized protein YtfP
VFVYGTLQPGRLRWPYLEPFAGRHRPACVRGRLYDSHRGWPAASFADDAATTVPGTLVELDPVRLDEALVVLDAVEAEATDLLARVLVFTTAGEEAWVYHCAAPTAEMTPIERWVTVDER